MSGRPEYLPDILGESAQRSAVVNGRLRTLKSVKVEGCVRDVESGV